MGKQATSERNSPQHAPGFKVDQPRRKAYQDKPLPPAANLHSYEVDEKDRRDKRDSKRTKTTSSDIK